MYRYSNGQISLSDFKQPVGMNLKENNRWVKKAQIIPWTEIEKRYAALFTNRKGNVAKPLRLALGACIIQAEYGYSDEETALQIQENPYLQYFCGYDGYNDEKLPFEPSLMVYFRKRLTPAVLGEINEMILKKEMDRRQKEESDDDNSNENNDSSNDSSDNSNSGSKPVSGSKKAKVQKFVQSLKLTAAQKYLIFGYLGYSVGDAGKMVVKRYVNTLRLSAEGKKKFLKKYRKKSGGRKAPAFYFAKPFRECVKQRRKNC